MRKFTAKIPTITQQFSIPNLNPLIGQNPNFMYTTNKLWRRFSSIIIHKIHPSISISSSHLPFLSSHCFSYIPLHTGKPSVLLDNVSLNYYSHRLWSRKFCSQSENTNTCSIRCWNCNSSSDFQPFLVCGSCRCIQPVDPSIDYFNIFGSEKRYDIEEGGLEGKYKDWQKKLHPDLVHSKSESERGYAAEQSARVIDAYRTLNNSLSRAIYLMKLHGVHVDEEQTVSDPDLLAEIMEIRESVEDAADSQELKQIQIQVKEKMKQWSESFANAFKSQDMEEALNAIRRMTYYKRANEEIVKRL